GHLAKVMAEHQRADESQHEAGQLHEVGDAPEVQCLHSVPAVLQSRKGLALVQVDSESVENGGDKQALAADEYHFFGAMPRWGVHYASELPEHHQAVATDCRENER